MYLYVILETYDKGKEIERFTEEKWNEVKPRLNPLRIVYVTSSLSDDKLKEFDPNDPIKYDFALFGLGVNEK